MFETAGSLRAGRQVFIRMRLPEMMKVGGSDRVDLYIAALNSHDATSAFCTAITPMRVERTNSQAAALRDNVSKFNVRHTAGAKRAVPEACNALGLTFAYCQEFQAEAEKLIRSR